MLGRRDAERGIGDGQAPSLSLREKLHALQYLAWRLSLNNRTELERSEAVRRLGERVAALSRDEIDPAELLDHLIDRSGVVREPRLGRIDFVHRTFQEYLTAREAAEQGDVGFLTDRAHLDTWRETVVMAAGHAHAPDRNGLLTSLLDRADAEPGQARRLRLLAASCLETAGPLDRDVRDRIDGHMAALMPPRQLAEARSLAAVGAPILRYAPADLSELSEVAASAVVQVVALVGGDAALDLLERYTADSRYGVQQELSKASVYFTPDTYAERVLSSLHTFMEWAQINSSAECDAWRRVSPPPHFDYVQLSEVRDLGEALAGLTTVTRLWVSGPISDLSSLDGRSEHLEGLSIWSSAAFADTRPLTRLRRLNKLVLSGTGRLEDVDFLRSLPKLKELLLDQDTGDYTALLSLNKLRELRLFPPVPQRLLALLPQLPSLTHLSLLAGLPPGELRSVLDRLPQLTHLTLYGQNSGTVLDEMSGLPHLLDLDLSGETIDDLSGLRFLPQLERLRLDTPSSRDLAVLGELPRLSRLSLSLAMNGADLSVLRGRQLTIVCRSARERTRLRRELGPQARLQRD
ncbi:hypothetical protein [Streptomyces sp. NPDC049881]|uniref:NACHT domain-containing protein n=1 Tax=Streptomyces sp. NPDC049881 TaxID=3155778 RepID=UPI00342DE951